MSVDFPDPDTPVTATKTPDRDVDVECAEVVLARAVDRDRTPQSVGRPRRDGIASRSGTARERRRIVTMSSTVRSATISPPCFPAPGPEVDHVVRRAHRLLVVLDHDDGVAEVAQVLERGDQRARCHAGAARSTARRGCTARRRAASRSASPAGFAAPRRPTATRRGPAELEVVEPDVHEEAQSLAHLLEDPPRDLSSRFLRPDELASKKRTALRDGHLDDLDRTLPIVTATPRASVGPRCTPGTAGSSCILARSQRSATTRSRGSGAGCR